MSQSGPLNSESKVCDPTSSSAMHNFSFTGRSGLLDSYISLHDTSLDYYFAVTSAFCSAKHNNQGTWSVSVINVVTRADTRRFCLR